VYLIYFGFLIKLCIYLLLLWTQHPIFSQCRFLTIILNIKFSKVSLKLCTIDNAGGSALIAMVLTFKYRFSKVIIQIIDLLNHRLPHSEY
jgi:hypothetical protein